MHAMTLSGYKSLWTPGEGCAWWADMPAWHLLRMNAHYIAPPERPEQWETWLQQARQYRRWVRGHLHDARLWHIHLQFDGVRAWIRLAREEAFAIDLQPGEGIVIRGEAKHLSGNPALWLAFDWCDRTQGSTGAWAGWSGVLAKATIPSDGRWHPFEIAVKVPYFNTTRCWARPIIGQDATAEPQPGSMLIRGLSIQFPSNATRQRLSSVWKLHDRLAFDDTIYTRRDLAWAQKCFVCGFIFIYDRAFWDPDRMRYRVEELLDEAKREFGGFDAVVLWHAYPRIGADERNQFDFWRDMPGGTSGVRRAVEQFHRHGVKVFIPYMPWDIGTRRESQTDADALAEMVANLEADGIFLDTMVESLARLREVVDAKRKGVVFEPEGHPGMEEMERCNASWAQWLQAYENIGVLQLKWVEPRHMQPQKIPAVVSASRPPAEALFVAGGKFEFVVKHMRRECGCYPDPGASVEEQRRFLTGNPFHEEITHRIACSINSFYIQPAPVTNAQYQAFLDATGYVPTEPTNFLKHWGGKRCPPHLRDEPVVYVDIDDARAYAGWLGARLPTEWEWQHAAETLGERFSRGMVWEWTESLRDDGHTRFVMLRGGSRYQASGSIWYFPGGEQPIASHAKLILLYPGLDRCSTIGFRCVWEQ
jgi:formylglycine-generating enzyme required for sulfatase activity